MLSAIIVLCAGAPLFAHYDPNAFGSNILAKPFSPGHLLGTDNFGRDIWTRLLYGGRYDLSIAFGATGVCLVFGLLWGMLAGHFGRPFGTLAMRIVDLVFAFPFTVLVIAIMSMLGSSLLNIFVALWLVSWVAYARIARGRTVEANEFGYVTAARALGFSHLRIIFRHTLPTVLPACIIFGMVDAVGNVTLAASLS
ncbi:MAG: ABC transporter permease, partial [Propionibacteriaceae bacterium]|nr:ABC transporter permease [Propionibacteriaceae bacterium]